jgi:cyclophilin family peptidyl-prolyl cis-trans isomerase
MKKIIVLLSILVVASSVCMAMGGTPPKEEGVNDIMSSVNPKVEINTSKGKMVVELFPIEAPKTVENFMAYVDTGFYDGTIFHRVIPGFMVQGGGFTKGMVEKMVLAPVKNEAGNGLTNDRGTLAMARTAVVDSATAQFFINVADNTFLNHKDNTAQGYGYCVFGKVVEGMDVADAIVKVDRHSVGYFDDVPVEDVTIISVKQIK